MTAVEATPFVEAQCSLWPGTAVTRVTSLLLIPERVFSSVTCLCLPDEAPSMGTQVTLRVAWLPGGSIILEFGNPEPPAWPLLIRLDLLSARPFFPFLSGS